MTRAAPGEIFAARRLRVETREPELFRCSTQWPALHIEAESYDERIMTTIRLLGIRRDLPSLTVLAH